MIGLMRLARRREISQASPFNFKRVTWITATATCVILGAACWDAGDPPRPAMVTVSPVTVRISTLGKTVQLTAQVYDQYGEEMSETTVTWTSDDTQVATVDHQGLVTGLADGTATITAVAGAASGAAVVTVDRADRIDLVELYNATGGTNWVNNTNWLTDAPLAEWYGVDADRTGRVRGLDLSQNRLSGPIPRELGGLSSLVFLNLAGNALSGPIPPEVGDLSNLEMLCLSANKLSGPIPPELGDLSNLERMCINNNKLSGPIPSELGNLSNLEWLSLGFNRFTGALPRTFLNLTSLRSLGWGCGRRRLCVPGTADFVAWLSAKNVLEEEADFGPFCNDLDRAVLTGFYELAGGADWNESTGWLDSQALDEWHGVGADWLGRVTAIHLSDNELSGALSAGIGTLGQLTSLRIDGNELSGRLPLSLPNLELAEFHYDGTGLCEPDDAEFRDWLDGIPSRRGTGVRCAELTERDVLIALYEATEGPNWVDNTNWLTDAPLGEWYGVELDATGRIRRLRLAGRWDENERETHTHGLTGTIPPEMGRLSNLETLLLERNELYGPIPPEIGGLSNLRWLGLWSNDLSGPIPPALGDLSNLVWLELGGNELSGPIPPALGNLSNLRSLDLLINSLSGPIPPELGNLLNLRSIDFWYNELSGPIPPELGNLSNLGRLQLGANELSGPIPAEIGGLSNLRWLGIQQNDVSGPIPAELGGLSDLESLRLELSNLSGPIPAELTNLSNLRLLWLYGNSGLDGQLPASMTGMTAVTHFEFAQTALCAPVTAAFQTWLNGMESWSGTWCSGAMRPTPRFAPPSLPDMRDRPPPHWLDPDAILKALPLVGTGRSW